MAAPPDPPADPGALFARLFARHHQDLFGYVFALVPNWADADDVLQETGVKLWEGFARFRPGSNFVAWACTVAHYQVLAHRRRKRGVFAPDLLDQLAADAGAVAEEADDRRDALRDCLGKLPAARRRLLELVYADDGSAAAAAAELGRPLPSVYAGLSQARRQLRDCVNDRLGRPAAGDADGLVAGAVAALTAGGGPGRLPRLLADPAARRAYAELMHDTVGLRQWAGVRAGRPRLMLTGGAKPPRRPPAWPWWAAGGGLAAAALVLGLGPLLRPAPPAEVARPPDPAPTRPADPPPPPAATLVAAAGAEWEDGPRAAGDQLPAGVPLALRAGTVAVRLESGAELVLRGPCTVVPEAGGAVTLRAGGLTATLPADSGLTVRTPAGDLAAEAGAEFAAAADGDRAEAHVLAGAVVAGGRRLAPQAAAALSAGGVADRPFDPGRFPAPGGLDPARPVAEEFWLNVRDDRRGGLTPLLRHPAFVAGRADGRRFLPGLEIGPRKTAWEHYAARLTALLTPPAAGRYVFRVAADDNARLTLDGREIAGVPSHTQFREWARFPRQQSDPVWLPAGRPVRVEVLYLQRTLAAHLSVGWTLPDGTREDPIPAARLRRP